MNAPRLTVGEWLHAARENIGAVVFLFSIVSSGCGIVVLMSARWVDYRVSLRTEPIREILIWKLGKDGDLPNYLRDKARKDSLDEATKSRVSTAGYPLFMEAR